MHQLVVLVDHAIVHVGRMLAVIEKQQLAVAFIHFAMRRNAVQRRPGRNAYLLQTQRVQAIALTALVKRGQGKSGMHNHIGA